MKTSFSLGGIILLFVLIQQAHSQKASFKINCGGPSSGAFVGDATGTPGWFSVSGNANNGGGSGVQISGGGDANYALKTHKWGPGGSSIIYTFSDLQSGNWDCTLHFAEMSEDWNTPGKRVFHATLSGQTVQTMANIDIMAAVGFKKAKSYSFSGLAIQSTLTVDLTSVTGNPMISAITCARTGGGGGGPTSTPSPTSTPGLRPPGPNLAVIIGVSIGAVLLIIIIGIVIYVFLKRRPGTNLGRRTPAEPDSPTIPAPTYY